MLSSLRNRLEEGLASLDLRSRLIGMMPRFEIKPSRHERAAQREYEELRAQRRKRFRILACVDGTEDSLETVRFAARFGKSDECDIILLFVRPIDIGMATGGLQVRIARQNMLDWGIELPGIRDLKQALEVLRAEGIAPDEWNFTSAHTDVWGDPLGDNKIEYKDENTGRSVVLKLKTAPDVANGILDQYELGPYNLIIVGEPSRWRGELKSWFDAGVVQKITVLAPCSVLVARKSLNKQGFFICTDGSERSMNAVRRAAVLARHTDNPITLFSAARSMRDRNQARENVEKARAALKKMRINVARTKVGIGEPAEQIIRHGSGHQVIVVSDEGRSRLERIIRGSVANEVVRGARTSVLDVR